MQTFKMFSVNFVVTLFAVSTWILCVSALQYSDMQMLGVEQCPEMNSCVLMRDSIALDRICRCDSACGTFNDCCIDAPSPTFQREQQQQTCVPSASNLHQGHFAISNCPIMSSAPLEIQQQCQNNNFSDPLMSSPVTDTRNNKTYLNRYCALCNDASEVSLTTWVISACKVEQRQSTNITFNNLIYREDLGKWGLNRQREFFPCEFRFDKPLRVSGVRQCWTDLVSTCPSNWRRQLIVNRCRSYMSVMMVDSTAYRNPHCAICNGVRQHNKIKCFSKMLLERKPKPFSFALLLDVNQRDGDRVGAVQRCPADERYDPFFKKCRKLVCPIPGMVKQGDKCVQQRR